MILKLTVCEKFWLNSIFYCFYKFQEEAVVLLQGGRVGKCVDL